MEKTFREVIRDIKEGEVWERYTRDASIKIKLEDGFIMMWKNGDLIFTFGNKYKFKTNKEEHTFEEAFKAYEEGKEINKMEIFIKEILKFFIEIIIIISQ